MNASRYQWLGGIGVFVVALLLLVFVCGPIQAALGLWGVAITELILLGVALAGMVALRFPFRETFPLRRPRASQVAGTVFMVFSALFASMPFTLILFHFFPAGFQVSEALAGLTQTLPLPLAWVFMAVFPAVCEEALFRGLMVRSFGGFRSRWAVILLTGLIFGAFHLDPFRFLPTAFLGVLITYIRVKTDNMLLPILYHLVNNSMSTLAGQVQTGDMAAAVGDLQSVLPPMIGIYLIIGAFGVLAVRGCAALIGFRDIDMAPPQPEILLREKRHTKITWLITGAIALAMVVSGIAVFARNAHTFLDYAYTQMPYGL